MKCQLVPKCQQGQSCFAAHSRSAMYLLRLQEIQNHSPLLSTRHRIFSNGQSLSLHSLCTEGASSGCTWPGQLLSSSSSTHSWVARGLAKGTKTELWSCPFLIPGTQKKYFSTFFLGKLRKQFYSEQCWGAGRIQEETPFPDEHFLHTTALWGVHRLENGTEHQNGRRKWEISH